ncbi:Methyl-accepting chemotaxis protein IV [Arcobacter porcinus]|uniref:Methyl-accepting chemotaxis protein IV n=1 Tax=Arcobacter porcinus TaxID=1935204 RepID=A0ABX2YBP4_9BACT|nr:methyl-accepting chemotaxis protein [Arcobacter porcinus]OCL84277.1 Methyl-accepting chemotaxis protein IV [Arcobacter porcinus]OCL91752.1 Methyl-accepting chemotaxis protein IV [Arcobacter porcinus]
MKISNKLYFSFGLIILLIIILTVLGINRVSIIDNTLQNDVELTSSKQRYAINFRGSVHDRAIAIRDVVLSENKDNNIFKKAINDIKNLEEFYKNSAFEMDKIFENRYNFTKEELEILNNIKEIENNTLPIVYEIITLKKDNENSKAQNLLLEKANPLFTNWLKTINEFIDYQEAKNFTHFSEIREIASKFSYTMIIFLVIAILLAITVTFFISKQITNSLNKTKSGLEDFFKFVNRESLEMSYLNIKSNDEFGEMANLINNNIEKTKVLIIEDNQFRVSLANFVKELKSGNNSVKFDLDLESDVLKEIKFSLIELQQYLEQTIARDINVLLDVLQKFKNKDYTARFANPYASVAITINELGDVICEILKENKANGLTLDQSSNILLKNVDRLNISSKEASYSLEETTQALDKITNNIRNNTQSISQMSNLAQDVTKSANIGETLANKTTLAMDEINTQVNLVNEAISVIDQIAFQTNILSLNAAVEAATAGEAGKGFAVVAQEVRNLANRSAEAANEIKSIVENAKNKANEGKDIANSMIEGYKNLNLNISSTMNLIDNIQNASNEQLSGIEQINEAVNSLEMQTNKNASIAKETQNIATLTDDIAKLIVKNADEKEFIGKKDVKAKDFSSFKK